MRERRKKREKNVFKIKYRYTLRGTIKIGPHVPRCVGTSGSSTFIVASCASLHVHFFAAGSGLTCKAQSVGILHSAYALLQLRQLVLVSLWKYEQIILVYEGICINSPTKMHLALCVDIGITIFRSHIYMSGYIMIKMLRVLNCSKSNYIRGIITKYNGEQQIPVPCPHFCRYCTKPKTFFLPLIHTQTLF